jgi:hypothetical protein
MNVLSFNRIIYLHRLLDYLDHILFNFLFFFNTLLRYTMLDQILCVNMCGFKQHDFCLSFIYIFYIIYNIFIFLYTSMI